MAHTKLTAELIEERKEKGWKFATVFIKVSESYCYEIGDVYGFHKSLKAANAKVKDWNGKLEVIEL